MSEEDRPKVGVGLVIIKNGTHILMSKRIGKHGAGEYGGLGGHMENGESAQETILRELREEAGNKIKITKPRLICISNVRSYAPKHFLDIGMAADWISGEPELMEPKKFVAWEWHPLDNLPKPLFEFLPFYIEALKSDQPLIDV